MPCKENRAGNTADSLTDYRCKCGTALTHSETDNKSYVKNKIEYGGNADKHKRVLRVAHSAKNCARNIITVNKNKTNHTDRRISDCPLVGFGRSIHKT